MRDKSSTHDSATLVSEKSALTVAGGRALWPW
jgi:hypothetical protein